MGICVGYKVGRKVDIDGLIVGYEVGIIAFFVVFFFDTFVF